MAEDQLRSIVDGIRTRLQSELDTQLAALSESHEHALAELGRNAEAEAERRWAAKLETARAEWGTQLQSQVAAARSEVERRMVAESMRARVEAEQAAAEAATQAKRELDQAVAAERKRAEDNVARLEADVARLGAEVNRLGADSSRLAAELEDTRNRADRDREEARAAFDAERAATADELAKARTSVPASAVSGDGAAGILEAVRAIDDSTSLSAALSAVTRAAASHAPRAAMFVVHESELREWPVEGVTGVDAGPIRAEGREAGFLSDALQTGEPVAIGEGGTLPAFARIPQGSSAIAVPFTLGGQPVAVLYADAGHDGGAAGAWQETVQILGRHASACLAYLTALKTAQAMHLLAGGDAAPAAANDDEAQGARRYARLLVSEIKLYNEGAVRVGRERRDLMKRLKSEIDRARKLYEERVPVSVRERDTYFQQELVQTLAGGDQSALG
jgi:hypothetical protein